MQIRNLTENDFVETLQTTGIVLIDWWAAWCGPCDSFAPIYKAAAERHEDVTFTKVNTDEQPDLVLAFHIQAIPTLMAVRDGIVLFSEAGFLPAGALDELIEGLRSLDMDDIRRQIAF